MFIFVNFRKFSSAVYVLDNLHD